MTQQPDPLSRFADAVADMRHAQKEYFRTPVPTALIAAIREERKVDALLEELRQPNLLSGLD